MALSASSAPLPRKMFQHFAVITVVITTGIAVFADGQGDNVFGKAVAAREAQAQSALAQAAPKRAKPVSLLDGKIHDSRTSRLPPGFEGESSDSGYGQPMDPASGIGGGGSSAGYTRPAPRFPSTAQAVPTGAAKPSEAPDPRAPAARKPPSRQERAQLEAASLARSGDRGED